jgi:hypothetical protein
MHWPQASEIGAGGMASPDSRLVFFYFPLPSLDRRPLRQSEKK